MMLLIFAQCFLRVAALVHTAHTFTTLQAPTGVPHEDMIYERLRGKAKSRRTAYYVRFPAGILFSPTLLIPY